MCGVRLFSRNFDTDDACALLLLLSDEPSSVGRLIFARPRNVFIRSLMFQLFFAEHSMTCFGVADESRGGECVKRRREKEERENEEERMEKGNTDIRLVKIKN